MRSNPRMLMGFVVILMFTSVLLMTSQVGTAQINPTEQQQTIDAAINQFFTQTSQAEQQVNLTQTVDAAFGQSLTATAVTSDLTAAFEATIQRDFDLALTATAIASLEALVQEEYEVTNVSFRYPTGWFVSASDDSQLVYLSSNSETLLDISQDGKIDYVADNQIALSVGIARDFESDAQMATVAESIMSSFGLSQANTIQAENSLLNGQPTGIVRGSLTSSTGLVLETMVLVLQKDAEMASFVVAVARDGQLEDYLPIINAVLISVTFPLTSNTVETSTPSVVVVTPVPSSNTSISGYEIRLEIISVSCIEAQEDRPIDVAPSGDEISLVYAITETNSSGGGSGLSETSNWIAPSSMEAGDSYSSSSFAPITMQITERRGINVSFVILEDDRFDESDQLGGYSNSYSADLIASWITSGTGGIQVTETVAKDEFGNRYTYIVTFAITAKAI